MSSLFLNIFNMSITAGWIVLAVIIIRFVLKKAPKWLIGILWAFVAIRLICPFSIESSFSIIPSINTLPANIINTATPAIHSGISAFNSIVNPIISSSLSPDIGDSVNPMQIIIYVASIIWILGIAIMLIYTLLSYIKIKKKINEAIYIKDNIWLGDYIPTPFILGIAHPKIYLPTSIAQKDLEYVIAHENTHLKRYDHIWKPLGYLLLIIYWFNPILWIGYILFCRDIELACDERVIKKMSNEYKKRYSNALINCSISDRKVAICSLAFGEIGVKERIKNMLSYKKPTIWIIIITVVIIAVTAICLLTNPVKTNNISMNEDEIMQIDKIAFDIDKDGKKEDCVLGIGPTSGLFTFTFTASENGKDEYFNIYTTEFYSLSFVKEKGEIKLKGTTQGVNSQTYLFDISIQEGNIVLSHNGENITYWGEQGINSKYMH